MIAHPNRKYADLDGRSETCVVVWLRADADLKKDYDEFGTRVIHEKCY